VRPPSGQHSLNRQRGQRPRPLPALPHHHSRRRCQARKPPLTATWAPLMQETPPKTRKGNVNGAVTTMRPSS